MLKNSKIQHSLLSKTLKSNEVVGHFYNVLLYMYFTGENNENAFVNAVTQSSI